MSVFTKFVLEFLMKRSWKHKICSWNEIESSKNRKFSGNKSRPQVFWC